MKSTFITLLLLCSITVFSQKPTSVNTDYLKKSKNQKTVAWILVSGGLLSTAIGSVQFNNGDGTAGNSRNTVFLVTGLAAIGTSIPLFIASSKNKKKATAISFKMETVPEVQQQSFVYHSYPALSFSIPIH